MPRLIRPRMRTIVVSEFVSLDGVVEDPGGAEKFKHGGWSFKFRDDEVPKYKLDELLASDALLLGRVTYEGFAKAWPSVKDDVGFADKMNNISKYVVSTTLKKVDWNNSRLIRANVTEEVKKLKQLPGKDILVYGSRKLVNTLLQMTSSMNCDSWSIPLSWEAGNGSSKTLRRR